MSKTNILNGNLTTLKGPFLNFIPNEAPNNPIDLFSSWFQIAINEGVAEPHAMTLSTIGEDGFPDARVLILKYVDESGWYFATSSSSSKGKQLQAQPNVALTFYWKELGRQVRIRGTTEKMSADASAKDFLARGEVARAIALIGRQSAVLANPSELEDSLRNKLETLRKDPDLSCRRVDIISCKCERG